MTEPTDAPMTFEQALERLEKIAAAMESGKLGLEKMLEAYEVGQGLVQFCSGKLNEVEKKIEKLVKKSDGTSATAPLQMD